MLCSGWSLLNACSATQNTSGSRRVGLLWKKMMTRTGGTVKHVCRSAPSPIGWPDLVEFYSSASSDLMAGLFSAFSTLSLLQLPSTCQCSMTKQSLSCLLLPHAFRLHGDIGRCGFVPRDQSNCNGGIYRHSVFWQRNQDHACCILLPAGSCRSSNWWREEVTAEQLQI